jgi:hypothetical protein
MIFTLILKAIFLTKITLMNKLTEILIIIHLLKLKVA